MRAFLLPMLLGLILSCGGGGGTGAPAGAAPGRADLRLAGGASRDYPQMVLDVQRVEVAQGDGDWRLVAEPRAAVDLVALAGSSTTLAQGVALPPGRYTRLRLVLGSENRVVLDDQSIHPLGLAPGLGGGAVIPLDLTVLPGGTRTLVLAIDPSRSVHLRVDGTQSAYLLAPAAAALDLESTAALSGVVKGPGGVPLPGAMVLAQTLDTGGSPVLLRAAQTGPDGAFVLDLLPVGASCFLATQPVLGGVGYTAAAAGPFALPAAGAAAGTLEVAPLQPAGTVTGSIQPTAVSGQSDLVLLQSTFVLGGVPRTLITRTRPADVLNGFESFTFPLADTAIQSVRGIRSTLSKDGSASTAPSLNAPVVNPMAASPLAPVLRF
ncbi:MAG: DUF4382 domain-containing protein [Holophagaceae bacterium]